MVAWPSPGGSFDTWGAEQQEAWLVEHNTNGTHRVGAKHALVNGVDTVVLTKYLTGTLVEGLETNVLHEVTAANILSVGVWVLSSDGNYYGKDHGVGPVTANNFAVHYDSNTIDIHSIGSNIQGRAYRIKIEYTE